MPPAPLPPDEAERVAALHRMNVLDTPAEERLDRIVKLAAVLMKTPSSMITLLEGDRQWFKACHGVPVNETPRAVSFCAYAIFGDDPLVVEDATLDQRFADNPVVVGEPFVRFYMGCPVRSPEGKRLGTLCVIDVEPHRPTTADVGMLQSLADWAQTELHVSKYGAGQQRFIAGLTAAERKTLMDASTALWNADGLRRVLQHETGPVLRVDIKPVSETVVKQTAEWLRFSVRPTDALAYLGGGRFAVLLPDTDDKTADAVANVVREAIARAPVGDVTVQPTVRRCDASDLWQAARSKA